MNVNKKFDRFKQWAGEKLGGEATTTTSEEFKQLELEMNLRHEGMEKLHKSMSTYVKAMTSKTDGTGDKQLPIGYLGSTMISHGHDFSPDSEFGQCLNQFGRANETLARKQDAYTASATQIWLESLERSLAQMKEYQNARKKLETRRLAYDASLGKMQKAKKEDFRVEEDLRAQKAKYEESSEDVFRRMEDIKESEVESVADLTHFLEAELEYHEACREVLLELKRNWPAQTAYGDARRLGRARSNTAHSFTERLSTTTSRDQSNYGPPDDDLPPVMPPRTNTSTSAASLPRLNRTDSLRREISHNSPTAGLSRTNSRQDIPSRPSSITSASYSSYTPGPTSRPMNSGTVSREYSPERRNGPGIPASATSESVSPIWARTALRPVMTASGYSNDDYGSASPRPGGLNRISSHDSHASSPTSGSLAGGIPILSPGGIKKAPPPPPPSRGKKPAPPLPVKRASNYGDGNGLQGGTH